MKQVLVLLIVFLISSPLLAQDDDQMGKVAIHGFVSQGYMQSTDNNFMGNTKDGTFEFNELGINFTTELTENLRVGAQLFARDLGNYGNDELIVDWAYGDYRWKNWLGLRAGKMKMPLGLYNEYRDLDMARVNIFMPQGVYNETWRDSYSAIKGVGLYGSVNTGIVGTFDYQLQAGALNINTNTGVNQYLEDQLYAKISEYDLTSSYLASLQWETPVPGLKLGASYITTNITAFGTTEDTDWWEKNTVDAVRGVGLEMGADPADPAFPPEYSGHDSYLYAKGWMDNASSGTVNIDLVNTAVTQQLNDIKAYWLSAEYTYHNLVLAAEYYKLTTRLITSLDDYSYLGEVNNLENDLGGFYGSASYRFSELFEAGTYYSEYYPDLSDKDGKGYERVYGFPASNSYLKDIALSLRFDINPYWIIKLEGHSFNGTAVLFRDDQEDPHDMKEDWFLGAVKLTYNF